MRVFTYCLLVFVMMFALPATLMAKSPDFEVHYDSGLDDSGAGIARDSAGNIIVVGSAGQNGLILKYNPGGDIIWEETFSADVNTSLSDVAVDAEGNIYAVGSSRPATSRPRGGAVMVKFSPDGVLLWSQQRPGGDSTSAFSSRVAVDAAGVVHVLEHNLYHYTKWNSYPVYWYWTSSDQQYVSRYDSNGTQLGTMSVGYRSDSNGVSWNDMAVSADGGQVYLAGRKSSNDYSYSVVSRFNADGAPGWERVHDFNNERFGYYEYFGGVALDPAGDVLVGGQYLRRHNSNAKYEAVFLKYSAAGVLQWQQTYEGTDDVNIYDIASDDSGSLTALLRPVQWEIEYEQGLLFVKVSAAGDIVSDMTYKTNNLRYTGSSIVRTALGSYLVVGSVDSVVVDGVRLANETRDALLLKFND